MAEVCGNGPGISMSIHIYNSLSRKKEEFVPLKPPQVNIYTCGVTVYDDCHIGHARSLYTFDVIRRYLAYRGYTVRFIRNITDIDDKIINRARELNEPWDALVARYIAAYYADMQVLGIARADGEPRATENIPDMLAYIRGLIDKGYAYETGGDVYFDVRKFSGYGRLSGQSVDQMYEGVRKESSEGKRDPLDFALWKKSKDGEPSWESPWGKGRPGWHIECSVMSQKYLGVDTLDIHAGGRDLIFPHHENETAQAEALTGKPFAKYWIHHGLLTINSQKMSKSLGNFITIRDFMKKYANENLLKLFFLTAHYAHPIDYTDAKVEESRQALERIAILYEKSRGKREEERGKENTLPPELREIRDRFFVVMDDDFNTPQALAVVFDLVTTANKRINDADFAASACGLMRELLGILGISLDRAVTGGSDDADIEQKIAARNQARKDKNYPESDRIRKELDALGIVLEDTRDGRTTWRRKL